MGEQEKYILREKEIFPFAGKFDFNNSDRVDEKDLTWSSLVDDIGLSMYGNKTVAEDQELNISEKLRRRNYSLISKIEEHLHIDFEKIVDEGSYQQKVDAFKLLKLLYRFTKEAESRDIISLLERPSLNNIKSDYCEYPFYTDIQELKEILDFLNVNRHGEDYPEIEPTGYEAFTFNEAIAKNQVISLLADKNIDSVRNLNDRMGLILGSECDQCNITFADSFELFSDTDIVGGVSSAMDRYYLKCYNATFLSSLDDCNAFFQKTKFFDDNDDLCSLFKTKKKEIFHEDIETKEMVEELFSDPNVLKLTTRNLDELTKNQIKKLNSVKSNAEYVLRNYKNMNWEETERINFWWKYPGKQIGASILQMLYLCEMQTIEYTTESIGDQTQRYSLKNVFSHWNYKKHKVLSDQIKGAEEWLLQRAHNRSEKFRVYKGGWKNEFRRDKGKEYLMGKFFPQFILVRNLLLKEEFDEYVKFLKNYHDIQGMLCNIIDEDIFYGNCDLFFSWLFNELDLRKPILMTEEDEVEAHANLFRNYFFHDPQWVYKSLFEKCERNQDKAESMMYYFENNFIETDIEYVYQTMKKFLPERCRTEFRVLQEAIHFGDFRLKEMLKEDYGRDVIRVMIFLRDVFDRLTEEDYQVLKRIFRARKNLDYHKLKEAFREDIENKESLLNLVGDLSEEEYCVLKKFVVANNWIEYSLIRKLALRK